MFTNKKPDEAASATPRETGQPPTPDSRVVRGQAPRPEKKSSPSMLSTDLFVTGNLKSDSGLKIEGNVDGDIRAQLIQIGEKAIIKGQIAAEEVVVNGRVKGKIRGIRVRLNNGARVEGDIVHETIAIEAGAHFEGTVKRKENPIADQSAGPAPAAKRRQEAEAAG